MNDFFDLHEVDAENVSMRLFIESFGGEVRKWLRALPMTSINTLSVPHRQFLDRWDVKKNPLQILSEYENTKRNVGESVQDYYVRFNVVYNAIPANIKPPMGLALIKFPDGFDSDMAYQLWERDPTTLENMQKNAVSVEENLLAKTARMKTKKKVTIKEETSSLDVKADNILWKIEKMFDWLTVADKPETTIRNPNFRGQRKSQFKIKQREQKAQDHSSQ